jgi:hypothetical protein
MISKKYRKLPVEIEAIQLTDGPFGNHHELAIWCDGMVDFIDNELYIVIHTMEGDMYAGVGDYIICGLKGEFYPCKPDIFEASYEEVE